MSRLAGSIVRGNFNAAPDIRLNGPAAGGAVYFGRGRRSSQGEPTGRRMTVPVRQISKAGKTGRGGRARTCDTRFWRPVLYQLSYTPKARRGRCRLSRASRFKHRGSPKCKGELGRSAFAVPQAIAERVSISRACYLLWFPAPPADAWHCAKRRRSRAAD